MIIPSFNLLRRMRRRMCGAALAFGAMALVVSAEESGSWFSPQIVWFPPAVPVFGERITEVVDPVFHRRLKAPLVLADFVNERFYPPLSTRLHDGPIERRLAERIDVFRAMRGALINELADQLVALHGADEAIRRTELQAFAAEQAPKLAALEREAEELRRVLIAGGALQLSADWSRRRKWVMGVTRFAGEQAEKEAQFQVVRAAAFYQDGLTPEQRGLLLEEAADLQQHARMARPMPVPRRGDPAAMFFSPETARMRLPRNATPGLLSRFARFNQERNALKQELRDAVWADDRVTRAERDAAFTTLADAQWPRIVELEKLAEEIRLEIAALPIVRLASPPHIPPPLVKQIEDYIRDRRKLIEDFQQTMRAATSFVSPPAAPARMTEDQRVQRTRQLAADRAAMRAKVAQAFQEIARERFDTMEAQYRSILADLAGAAAGQFDPETGRPLTAETLWRSYSAAMERFDTFGREEVIYRGYRTAMLMPGLSAAQRRLLFGAALVGLAQELPVGEYPPADPQPVPQS